MKQIQQLFKWTTLPFLLIALYTFTIGQIVPIEFADWHDMHLFYEITLKALPITILLTLAWTLKKERSKKTNIAIGIATPILALGMFYGTFFLMFSFGFGAWVDEGIIYQNEDNPQVTINEQLWDIGAFGYGGKRTVKLTPLLGLWNIVKEVNIAEIEKREWILIQKQEDIKFP